MNVTKRFSLAALSAALVIAGSARAQQLGVPKPAFPIPQPALPAQAPVEAPTTDQGVAPVDPNDPGQCNIANDPLRTQYGYIWVKDEKGKVYPAAQDTHDRPEKLQPNRKRLTFSGEAGLETAKGYTYTPEYFVEQIIALLVEQKSNHELTVEQADDRGYRALKFARDLDGLKFSAKSRPIDSSELDVFPVVLVSSPDPEIERSIKDWRKVIWRSFNLQEVGLVGGVEGLTGLSLQTLTSLELGKPNKNDQGAISCFVLPGGRHTL